MPVTSELKHLALPIGLALLVFLLWNTFLVYPLKIFVVLLHEISHGLAAVTTGGSIVRIELSSDQGGLCLTAGGSRFWILNAGYLGSLVLGALLLVVGARSRADRAIAGAIGAATVGISLVYIRSAFGLTYGLLFGLGLIAVAWKLPESSSDLLLKTLGVVSCLYVPWDIASDAWFGAPGSDASALGELTWIPGSIWAGIWIGIAALVVWYALKSASERSP